MAAIGRVIVALAADVVGYSSLVGAEEKGALERLETHRCDFIYPKIAEHDGRVLKAAGSRLLAEFASPIEAVQCAVEVQRGMIDRNLDTARDRRIMFRAGINIDEAAANGNDLVSRAVAALPADRLATLIKPGVESGEDSGNVAVRLAALAEPGGICISRPVWDVIRDRLPYRFENVGKQNLDINAAPVRCYAMSADSVAVPPRAALLQRRGSATRYIGLRNATVAVSMCAVVGIWAVGLWAWLSANSSTSSIRAPVTEGSRMSSVSSTVVTDAQAALTPQPSIQSSTAADKDIQTPPPPQAPARGNTEADGSPQAPPARSTSSEIGAAVIRGKQGPSVVQTMPNGGPALIRGIQPSSTARTALDSGANVVRGK